MKLNFESIQKKCAWLLNLKWEYTVLPFVFALTACLNFGLYHWDELFQTIEPAVVKLGIGRFEDLPWEFVHKVRPWFQIWVYYVLAFFTHSWWVENRFFLGTVCQVFNGIIFAFSFSYFLKRIHFLNGKRLYFYLILSFYSVVFFAVRSSSESLSTSFFFLALGLLLEDEKIQKKSFLAALLLGLSFQTRYQMGIPIVCLGAWLLFVKKQRNFQFWISLASGFVLIQVLGQLLNRLGYGVWVFPEWNYFHANLVQGVASQFGVSPYWGYINELGTFFGWPFTLLLAVAFIYCCIVYWREVWIWISLPHFIIHSAIPHKELRFLMPILALVPLFWIVAAIDFKDYLRKSFRQPFVWKTFNCLFVFHLVVFNFFGWANRNVRPVEPKFHILKAFHKFNQFPLHYVYNDIDPLHHGDHSFKLYNVEGQHLKMEMNDILNKIEKKEFFLKNLIVSYLGELSSPVLDQHCRIQFKDESFAFWSEIYKKTGGFWSPPPPDFYNIRVLVCGLD